MSLFNKHMEKLIDDKTKCLVFGYIREYQRILNQSHNEVFYTIPKLVPFLCLHYYWIKEFWKKPNDKLILSDDFKSVTFDKNNKENIPNSAGGWVSCYGIQCVPSNSNIHCKWTVTFTVRPFGSGSVFCIVGIASNNNNNISIPFQRNTKDPNYAFYMQASISYYKYISKSYGDYRDWKTESNGNTVIIDLDLKQNTLKYYLNNKDCGVAYSNITKSEDIKYYLAVSLHGIPAKATIVDYCICQDDN